MHTNANTPVTMAISKMPERCVILYHNDVSSSAVAATGGEAVVPTITDPGNKAAETSEPTYKALEESSIAASKRRTAWPAETPVGPPSTSGATRKCTTALPACTDTMATRSRPTTLPGVVPTMPRTKSTRNRLAKALTDPPGSALSS
jgi:hypothetical protein